MAKQKFLNRISNAAEKVILSRVKNNNLFAEYYNRSDGKKAPWKRQPTVYDKKEIEDWTMAVMSATDPENPRRGQLMRFYQSLLLDLHLSSVIDTRILRVQRSSFKIVDENGNENDDLKDLLERPWHDELIRKVCLKTFQGTTLIEMFDIDDNGELIRINEIPQSNFIPQKGIIIKEEYDDNGVSYREGRYQDFYIQVGNDWELGMLNQLAMIVIAKKLGLGSWMSYIDKFGVPPLFAITERMDSGRRDELFDMLLNFRMNHFAVLQGNEKIEVPKSYNIDAYQSFKSLINDVCNTEISKRVLGGTATVDEKSFVGSAQIQERVAQDRYEADKLLYKYYFNTQIRQRLAKLSSIYAEFATHTLIWDNQETLDIKGYIEGVQKLSSHYEFDVEEIRNRTGLPITGIKSNTEPDSFESQKKKSSNNLNTSFKSGLAPFAAAQYNLSAATWDAATERMATQIYNGEIKPVDLDQDLVLKNYSALNKTAYSGWGEGYYETDITRKFRENLFKFSGAKSYRLMRTLNDMSKQYLSRDEYINKAKKTVRLHNETWLEVEKKWTSNSASSAKNFKSYMDDADIYPNLKNRTMQDKNVRESHRANEGIIKPIHEWKVIPPYDPGCRCWLEQTNEPATTDRKLTGIGDQWANNPYMSGKIFKDNHSYFKNIPARSIKTVMGNTELLKQFVPYNKTLEAGDKKVFVNDFADTRDLEQNIEAAKKLAVSLNKNVYIRPHINNIPGFRNPEFGIGSKSRIGDLKTYEPIVDGRFVKLENFINNSAASANKQGVAHLVIDISQYEGAFDVILKRRLAGVLNPKINRNVIEVIAIRGEKVSKISRKQVEKRNFRDFLEGLL